MKVKIDENLPRRVVRLCVERGHDAISVLDQGLGGAAGGVVFAAVVREARMLLTLDRGFGDIRRYPPGSHSGIVVLRCADQSTRSLERACLELLENHDLNNFEGCTVIVQGHLVRIRRE